MTLFWRSFLLIAALLVVSVLASFQITRVYEREPRARELAKQTVSVVNLTRAALVNADPVLRRELLIELNEREGIRIYPVTNEEKLAPLRPDGPLERVAARVRAQLGAATRFAAGREGMRGFWVSFYIDEDEFWVMLPRERFDPDFGLGWLGWARRCSPSPCSARGSSPRASRVRSPAWRRPRGASAAARPPPRLPRMARSSCARCKPRSTA